MKNKRHGIDLADIQNDRDLSFVAQKTNQHKLARTISYDLIY
ncbi:hypothetical protein ACLCDV_08355 [Sphingobacterium sp. Lzh-3]|nr:hypothetical protein [Sphingobacterium sp. UGAL515B_05]WON94705.1 hypothetical protein OK025_26130 [Sphingobacterium sp. UGAL515B_05]